MLPVIKVFLFTLMKSLNFLEFATALEIVLSWKNTTPLVLLILNPCVFNLEITAILSEYEGISYTFFRIIPLSLM